MNKITRTIFTINKKVSVKIHVNLKGTDFKTGKEEELISFTARDDKAYMNVNPQSFISLDLITDKELWSRDRSIILNTRNLFAIVKGLKKAVENIYDGGVFAVNEKNEPIIYSDLIDANTVRIFNLMMNQRLIVQPTIVYDETDVSYEGCTIFFNKMVNCVELTIDELEALLYILEKIDIFTYSQTLVNMYYSQKDNVTLTQTTKSTYKPRANVFNVKKTESVDSTLVTPVDDDTFNGLKS
jgi:hypothetical protein